MIPTKAQRRMLRAVQRWPLDMGSIEREDMTGICGAAHTMVVKACQRRGWIGESDITPAGVEVLMSFRIERIAAAVRRLANEHGVPNRWAAAEIAGECNLSRSDVVSVLEGGNDLRTLIALIKARVNVSEIHVELHQGMTWLALDATAGGAQ